MININDIKQKVNQPIDNMVLFYANYLNSKITVSKFNFQKINYKINDMFEIVRDFFYSLSNSFGNKFDEVLKSHNSKINYNSYFSGTRFKNGKVEINIHLRGETKDLLEIAHEMIHAIGWNDYRSELTKGDNLGAEIESLFIEKLFAKYLVEEEFIDEEEEKKLNQYNINYLVKSSNRVLREGVLYKLINQGTNDLNKILSNYSKAFNLDEFDAEHDINNLLGEPYGVDFESRYIYGEVISAILFKRCFKDGKLDKEAFDENVSMIEKFLKSGKDNDIIENVRGLGITNSIKSDAICSVIDEYIDYTNSMKIKEKTKN